MACPVLISPACVVAGKVVGAVAGTAASGALNGIAAAIESGITWMVTQTSTWWVQLPSPDLSGEPAVGRPAGQRRALDRLARGATRHRGGVQQPQPLAE